MTLRRPAQRRLLVVLVVWLLALSSPVAVAHAHAGIVRSDPSPGAALDRAPAAIELVYSERLDPSATSVRLVDSTGTVVAPGPGSIAAEDPHILRLALPDLGNGIYTVVWQVRSADDGDETRGQLSFSVGVEAPPEAALLAGLPPPGTPDPATALPAPWPTLLHWLDYLAAALMTGSLAFAVLVWRPALSQAGPADDGAGVLVGKMLRRIALGGAVAVALITLLQETNTPGSPIRLRGLALSLLILAVGTMRLAGGGRARTWWASLMLAAVVLASFAMQSHSAAQNGALGAALDWLHLMAMGVWLGGLLPLALVLALARRHAGIPPIAGLVPRFSRVALPCVAVLALTGLLNAVPLMRSIDALTSTTQGRALLAKLLLFGILVMLGAANLLVLSPRLGRGQGWGRRLQRTVRVELVLGTLVLLITSVLIGVAPAYQALEARARQGPTLEASTDGVRMTLRISPGTLGENAFAVDILDQRLQAESTPGAIVLRFSMPSEPGLATMELSTATRDGRRYTAVADPLTIAGAWQIEVILRRARYDDVRHAFNVLIR